MPPEPKDQRVPIMMTASELKAVDDWSFEQRIRSRGEAIRRLIVAGLEARGMAPQTSDGKRDPNEVMDQLIEAAHVVAATEDEKLKAVFMRRVGELQKIIRDEL